MVFGMSKAEREHREKVRAIRRKAFQEEDLKLAEEEGREAARIASAAALAKERAKATKPGGSGLLGVLGKVADYGAIVSKNIDDTGGMGLHAPSNDPFSQQGDGQIDDPYTPKKEKKSSKKERVDYLQ